MSVVVGMVVNQFLFILLSIARKTHTHPCMPALTVCSHTQEIKQNRTDKNALKCLSWERRLYHFPIQPFSENISPTLSHRRNFYRSVCATIPQCFILFYFFLKTKADRQASSHMVRAYSKSHFCVLGNRMSQNCPLPPPPGKQV